MSRLRALLAELTEVLIPVTNTAQMRSSMVGKRRIGPRPSKPGRRKVRRQKRFARPKSPHANAVAKMQAARRRKNYKAAAYWRNRV